MKVHDVRPDWFRLPLLRSIADATHILCYLDLILVEILAGAHTGVSYVLSLGYGWECITWLGVLEQDSMFGRNGLC